MLKVMVRRFERGLFFRDGDFVGLLGPGRRMLWRNLAQPGREAVEVVSTLAGKFEHKLLAVMVREPSFAEAVRTVELSDSQRALVWTDGRLTHILGPGLHAFWKTDAKLDVEVFEVGVLRFEHPKLETVIAHPDARTHLEWVTVEPGWETLLLVNGVVRESLAPGRNVFWKGAGTIRIQNVDKRRQMLDVAGQEIMTSDKVTLRVNLAVTYQVVDAARSVAMVSDAPQSLYREAQLLLRAAVGTRSLDQLLSEKEAMGEELRAPLSERAAAFGITVASVGLKDIILPGEMKTILNQVIEAEKKAQAESIKRREETASARSQANTARLLAENPMLARMKELEMVQQVLSGADVKFVFGSGELADQLRSLAGPASKP